MNRAAAGFQALGVRAEDRVALMLPSSGAFLESWFGLNLIGAVTVPIGTALIGEGLRHQIAAANCVAVVIEHDLLPALLPVLAQLTGLRHVILRHGTAPSLPRVESLTYDEFLRSGSAVVPVTPDYRALASISYTSGTTGLPKGVMISHNYWYEIWASAVRFARLVILTAIIAPCRSSTWRHMLSPARPC